MNRLEVAYINTHCSLYINHLCKKANRPWRRNSFLARNLELGQVNFWSTFCCNLTRIPKISWLFWSSFYFSRPYSFFTTPFSQMFTIVGPRSRILSFKSWPWNSRASGKKVLYLIWPFSPTQPVIFPIYERKQRNVEGQWVRKVVSNFIFR